MSYTNDLTYNPFSEYERDKLTTSQGFYSSTFLPNITTTRRRPSPLLSDEEFDYETHRRVQSETQIVPPSAFGLHPLKSALLATNAIHDNTHVTRPILSRIVGQGQNTASQEDQSGDSSSSQIRNDEKDVIVHHVTSKDSLAGVSLKYGITLANLRRANQLWTSDSIHRRLVLYIPVEEASRVQEYIQQVNITPATPDAEEEVTNFFDDTYSSVSEPSNTCTETTKPSVNVVRVPAKHLTYFPPSSNKNSEMTPSRHSLDNSSPTSSSASNSNKYNPLPLNTSLSSILTALPIAASTRDEIVTRLSFDSVSSSYSDSSRPSPPEENGHELYEVRKPTRGGKDKVAIFLPNDGDTDDDISMRTPNARKRRISLPPSPTTATRPHPSRGPAPGSSPKPSHIRSVSSGSSTSFYIPRSHENFLRTSQPEPSPAMEIPIRRSNTLGSASGKKLQATLTVERQHAAVVRGRGSDVSLSSLTQRMRS